MSGPVKAPWVICATCHGDSKVDRLGVVARSDFDDDEWDHYLEGGHDVHCMGCAGTGKVRAGTLAPIRRTGSDGQNVFYRDADDASEHMLRMAEGWA